MLRIGYGDIQGPTLPIRIPDVAPLIRATEKQTGAPRLERARFHILTPLALTSSASEKPKPMLKTGPGL